jgi:hypothetical protein
MFSMVRRRLLGDEEARAGEWMGPTYEEEAPSDAEVQTSSRLGALLVLLVPFAIVAWVAIGVSIYYLFT